MRYRRPTAPDRRRAGAQEGSLTGVTFIGSFPTTGFQVAPGLPEIAFVGRSNVGKSSLLNALIGRKAMARTSQTPGKTQACNVYAVANVLYLVDLPGYGYARASKRARAAFQTLLRDYVERRATLAGVVWLLDMRRDPSPDDLAMGSMLSRRGVPVLAALTKADKIARSTRSARARAIAQAVGVDEDQVVMTSTMRREGIAALREAVQTLACAGGEPAGGPLW